MPKPSDFDNEHDMYWYSLNDKTNELPGMGGVFNPVNLNAYQYAGNNPVVLVDPDGEIIVPLIYAYVAIARVRNAPDQKKLEALDNDPETTRIDIYTQNSAFGVKGAHHLYAARRDGEDTRGRTGSSQSSGTEGTRTGPRGAPHPGVEFENKVKSGEHTKVGEILLPKGVSADDYFQELEDHGNSGLYLPLINDCHNTLFDAAKRLGGTWKMNDKYQGRIGTTGE